MAERLRDVHPERHAGRPAERERLGDGLDQTPVRGEMREVHEIGRVGTQRARQGLEVEHAVLVDGQPAGAEPVVREGVDVRRPLAGDHAYLGTLRQRPGGQQREQRGGGATGQGHAIGIDAEQAQPRSARSRSSVSATRLSAT